MWYQEPAGERLAMVHRHHDEIRRDAREARRTSQHVGRQQVGRVDGLHLRLGRLLIVIGRSLREDETPCPDLLNS